MKAVLFLSTLAFANAALTVKYLRDLMTESTSRQFEKDPTTGRFRCEPGFTGSDCSMLKCPFSMAFTTSNIEADWLYTPSTAKFSWDPFPLSGETPNGKQRQRRKDTTFDNQHAYRECGGRGLCDRTTGECKCFASFTGEGCRRTTCPNDCSGHGQCRTDANSFYYIGQTPETPFSPQLPDYFKAPGTPTWGTNWPWLKYQQCVCDAGYEGDDCSLRRCPKGDDPETECSADLGVDVQELNCEFAKQDGKNLTQAYFQLRFTDQFGAEYDTRPILLNADEPWSQNANSIQDALEALPNFAIPEIEVDYEALEPAKPSITISFTDGHNTGKQATLVFKNTAACESGSQPLFRSAVEGGDITCTVERTLLTGENAYKESDTCSNRGICDQSTGRCNCFDGYFGLACDNVNTYI